MQTILVWKSLNFVVWERVKELLTSKMLRLLIVLKKRPFENIVGNGENAGHQHFSLFL